MFPRLTLNSTLLKAAAIGVPLVAGILIKDPLHSLYNRVANKNVINMEMLTSLYTEGVELQSSGDYAQATKKFKEALTSNPTVSKILVRLGSTAFNQNKFDEAVHYFKSSLSIEPRMVNAYVSLGMSYARLGKHEDAIKQFTIAAALEPSYFEAFFQMSKSYMDLKQFDKALKCAEKARELQPNNVHVYLNYGHIFNKKGELENAVVMYQKAISLDPNCANAHYNLGYTLRILKRLPEAMKHLNRAMELQDNYTDAHVCISQCYWTLDNFEKAWKEYEWRWKMLGVDPRKMDVPLWDGGDIKGKTILLYCEQGLGDTLQFIRFVKMVKQRGATTVVKVQKPLIKILESYPYIDKLIHNFTENMKFDVQAPLLNLPGILNIRANTIPAEMPYLKADAKLVDYWKQKLAHDKKFRVGLCWHVDPEHEIDKSPWAIRSFPAKLFTPLSKIAGTSFYSLQKINGEEQLKDLPDDFTVHIFGYAFDEAHGRFMDTAAVMMNLDLIITVDTSVAHLAAAMGKKVWMILPYSPDCRWYDNRSDTPWYPTMRLFRQPKPYDWDSVSKELTAALRKTLNK